MQYYVRVLQCCHKFKAAQQADRTTYTSSFCKMLPLVVSLASVDLFQFAECAIIWSLLTVAIWHSRHCRSLLTQ